MSMQNTIPSPRPNVLPLPSTLEELLQRKALLLQEIRSQKTLLTHLGNEAVAPFNPAVADGNKVLRAFKRGMAVFDGIILGMKTMRKIKQIFRKKSRYRY